MLKFIVIAVLAYAALHFLAPASLTGSFIIPGKILAAIVIAACVAWLVK